MTIALKLLGYISPIKDFLFKNWKIALIVLVFLGAAFYHFNAVKKSYESGRQYEADLNKKKFEEAQEEAKNLTDKLNEAVNDKEIQVVEKEKLRIQQETVYKDRVVEILKNDPNIDQCAVDPEFVEGKNKIRDLM